MDDTIYRKIFSKNLQRLMVLHDKTQVDIINDLGFTRSAVSSWVTGTRLPRMDKVDALAKYFQCNRSDLIEDKTEEAKAGDELSPAARELIDLMHQLEPEQIGLLLAFAKALLHRPQGS